MTRFGLEVAQNKDTSASRKEDLLYSSDFESPKVAKVATGSFMTTSGGTASIPVPHGLSYAPAIFTYIKHPDGFWRSVDNILTASETSNQFVTMQAAGLVALTQYYYKFWIFADPAQDITNV